MDQSNKNIMHLSRDQQRANESKQRQQMMHSNVQHSVGIGAITSFHSDDQIHMAHAGLMAGPGAAAANQQDVMSQFQHSVHGYTNNNINWYP